MLAFEIAMSHGKFGLLGTSKSTNITGTSVPFVGSIWRGMDLHQLNIIYSVLLLLMAVYIIQ
jgi:hypothetical protein